MLNKFNYIMNTIAKPFTASSQETFQYFLFVLLKEISGLYIFFL